MDLGDTDDGRPLRPATRGFHAARGVRLLHAAVRAFITLDPEASGRYDVAELGVPINQEDLIGTLLTFTVVVFEALERMGIAVDPADADAYLHTWCVVGHLLGIRPELLPLDLDAARDLDRRIRARQQTPTAEGVALMSALRSEMRSHMPRLLRRFPDALVHEFVGSDAANALGVPDPGWSRLLVELMQGGGWIWSRAPGRSARNWLSRILARSMIRNYIDEGRGDRPAWDYTRYIEPWKLERLRTRTARAVSRRKSA
jgi:ER-bound oxygenase mpaB/B'/Rubber oxygenase, catalytic domain